MAYDAQRDRSREVWAWLTATTPEMREECYARGYRRGLDAAMQFDPAHLDPDVPPELDGTHAQSWTSGYKEGQSDGQVFGPSFSGNPIPAHPPCFNR